MFSSDDQILKVLIYYEFILKPLRIIRWSMCKKKIGAENCLDLHVFSLTSGTQIKIFKKIQQNLFYFKSSVKKWHNNKGIVTERPTYALVLYYHAIKSAQDEHSL